MLIRKSIYNCAWENLYGAKTVGKTVEGRRKKTWDENNSEYSNPVPERTVALRRGNMMDQSAAPFSLNFTQPEKH